VQKQKKIVYPCTLEVNCPTIDSINYHEHQEKILFMERGTMQFSQASKVTAKTLLEVKPI
jgi:hypothetical protein